MRHLLLSFPSADVPAGVQYEQVYLKRDGLMERWDSFGHELHQNDTTDGYEWVDLRDLEVYMDFLLKI